MVPFLSLIHQGPYLFSLGLGSFWFEYWASKKGLLHKHFGISGDFIDLVEQALSQMSSLKKPIWGITRIAKIARLLRGVVPASVPDLGGFGTFVMLKKI